VTDERLMEMAPLYALGALDGEDLAEFGRSLGGSVDLQGEVAAYEAVVGRLALAHAAAPPARTHRSRTLGAAGFFPAAVSGATPAPSSVRPAGARPISWLAAAASIAAVVFLVLWGKRDLDYRKVAREAEAQRVKAERLELDVQQAHLQLAAVQEQLGREVAFRELVAHRASRQTNLAGLPAAPSAAARVVWNPATREAVLLAAGLDPAPPGKVYEAWVIANGAPAPAGTFQVDETGKAVFRLPTVDETAMPRTFAVTLEPEGGTRTPTGPMVLAGAVS
jgi:anti-sigma-K factor RskA